MLRLQHALVAFHWAWATPAAQRCRKQKALYEAGCLPSSWVVTDFRNVTMSVCSTLEAASPKFSNKPLVAQLEPEFATGSETATRCTTVSEGAFWIGHSAPSEPLQICDYVRVVFGETIPRAPTFRYACDRSLYASAGHFSLISNNIT